MSVELKRAWKWPFAELHGVEGHRLLFDSRVLGSELGSSQGDPSPPGERDQRVFAAELATWSTFEGYPENRDYEDGVIGEVDECRRENVLLL